MRPGAYGDRLHRFEGRWGSPSRLSGGYTGLFAVFVVGVLQNGLIQLNMDSFWIEVAQGVLLVGAVTFDQIRLRMAGLD